MSVQYNLVDSYCPQLYNIFFQRHWRLKMGRVKTFDRDMAVKVAMNEIWQHGFEACSVKYLSETLGMTRSSFYNAFGSRDELFLEVLQTYFEQTPDRELEYIKKTAPVLKTICEVFKTVCYVRASDNEHKGCLAINSVIELVGIDEGISDVLSNAVIKSMQRFESLLKLAAEKEELNSTDISAKAMALQNTLIGINVLCKVVHDGEELWRSTKETLLGLEVYKPSFQL
jgi:TetR/AcrR family transcriptional repressor of nem operon